MASRFTYDTNGNMITKTDPLGRTTAYTYDSLGHVLSLAEPAPSPGPNNFTPASMVRTAAMSQRAQIESSPNSDLSQVLVVTTYEYDPAGNLIVITKISEGSSSYTYDANNNVTSYTDALGNETTFAYDALNRLILITFPDGTTIHITYDFRDNVVTMTDQDGHVTDYQYDLSGRKTSITKAYGTQNATTTTFAYDSAGHVTSVTDALGHVTSYTYDAAGNLTGVSGVEGNFTFAYDNARNLTSAADGKGNTTQYQYDARKEITKVTYPDQTTMTAAYDGRGDITSVEDQAGNQLQYTYDAANELTGVIEVNSPNSGSNTESYSYDADGNLLTWTDPKGHSTTASYNDLGYPIGLTLPDGNTSEARQFDADGNLTSYTHFNGITTTYTYDRLNRLLTRATPGEATVSFTYTSTGKVATMEDASGTTTYTYDSMDHLTSKATPEGTLNYTYDAAGHVASVASSNSNGASIAYTYDDLNRLATVTDSRTSAVTTYAYDDASNVVTVTYPNGVGATLEYDQLNRVSGLATQQTGYAYTRGPTGNLIGSSELSGRTESWTYDGIYRLTNESITGDPSHNNGSASYGLDPVGNRLTESASLPNLTSGSWSYNSDDLLSSEAYDQNGNVIAEGGKGFTYDSENHLVSVGSPAATIVYDGFGNRVAKAVSGVTTRYLIDDLNPTGFPQVVDELTNGVVTRTYAYGLQRIDEDQIVSNTWTPSFYGYDGGGNVRTLTNTAGTITDQYEYDAFGNRFTVSGSTLNNYLYRGEQWDPDLGLYYLRARYYNPLTGRFLAKDPFPGFTDQPKTLHRYEYTGADPVNYIDPSGRDEALAEDAELEGEIDLGTEEGETNLGKRVRCLFETGAAALGVLTDPSIQNLEQFSYNLENCSAEGAGTQTCELCFAAGTPVHTDHGDVPIEKIQVGDEVIARNSKTGKLEKEPVTALTPRHTDALLELRIEGEHDALRPSTHHPFRARHANDPVDTWVDSGKLSVGDLLETEDGSWRRITAINSLPGEQTVYNFTVAKDHDYFVGETGFLVHNQNCGCGFGNEDHHIVPQGHPRAQEARDILNDVGLDINDDANILPLDYYYHRRIHTNAYIDWVTSVLRDAPKDKEGIVCALKDIGNNIVNGKATF